MKPDDRNIDCWKHEMRDFTLLKSETSQPTKTRQFSIERFPFSSPTSRLACRYPKTLSRLLTSFPPMFVSVSRQTEGTLQPPIHSGNFLLETTHRSETKSFFILVESTKRLKALVKLGSCWRTSYSENKFQRRFKLRDSLQEANRFSEPEPLPS